MHDFQSLHIERPKPGVMIVILDVPGRPVNVVDEGLLRDLTALVSQLEQDRTVRLVVFRGGKPSGFLAGADVKRMQRIFDAEQAETVLRAGQELFDRIAALRLLTVAVIHGPCLGGGLEFALACKFRIARDDAETRLGLPETQLGVIPGWGGTQRLPRLVGLEPALRMILEARRLPASKALVMGLVDMIATPDRFEVAVNEFLTDRLAGKPVRRPKRPLAARLRDETWPGRWLVLQVARRKIKQHAGHYPALTAALRTIEEGFRHGHARGLAAERAEFCRLLFSPACRHLLDLFFQRERARKPATWFNGREVSTRPVKTVAVIGAGTMGSGIAQLAADEGLDVVLKDIRQDLVDEGLKRIGSLMHNAVRSGSLSTAEADRRLQRITATVDWEPVSHADVAIEAVSERLDVKQDVFRELDQRLSREALIVSNTSALPIREMAAATARPTQAAGLHFFNPVHIMALVEVVRTEQTSDETTATLIRLVRDLGKVPIVVTERPGYFVNRILFPYLDEAVRLMIEGASPADVDREALQFGMPVGPVDILDLVGIDVAADVAHTLSPLCVEECLTPEYLSKMVEKHQLGMKSGAGFYRYRNGRKLGLASKPIRPHSMPRLPEPMRFGDGEVIGGMQQRLVLAIINSAADCLAERVVGEPWMVDLAMVLGTGFAPFRGGPLRLADAWGLDQIVTALDQLVEICGPRFKPCALLLDMQREGRKFHDEEFAERPAAALVGTT